MRRVTLIEAFLRHGRRFCELFPIPDEIKAADFFTK
ncbi:hypothetical protein EPYR_03762 [Erwinia pyrifoliae DSM 12163]|nr:hypothetical protein EPYR_03762 [Erwinia pyrifoliae DSM 12163]